MLHAKKANNKSCSGVCTFESHCHSTGALLHTPLQASPIHNQLAFLSMLINMFGAIFKGQVAVEFYVLCPGRCSQCGL